MSRKDFNKKRFGNEYDEGILTEDNRYKIVSSLDYLRDENVKVKKALDLGCNPVMTKIISEKMGIEAIGLNITSEGMDTKSRWIIGDIETGLPFRNSRFDLIFCGELIEHIFDADKFISEISRILRNGGYLILTTPNLASLWNRIFLLMGYQPHLFPVSTKKSYGNPFLKWDRFCGHVKVFTYKTMKRFLEDNGFHIRKSYGVSISNPNDNILKRGFRNIISKMPSLSEDVIYICKKV